jgi:hypothetical protein
MGAAARAVRLRILRAVTRAVLLPGSVVRQARRSILVMPLAIALVLAVFATGPFVPAVVASSGGEATGSWGLFGLVVPILALTALLTLALVGARLILARSAGRDDDEEDDPEK